MVSVLNLRGFHVSELSSMVYRIPLRFNCYIPDLVLKKYCDVIPDIVVSLSVVSHCDCPNMVVGSPVPVII